MYQQNDNKLTIRLPKEIDHHKADGIRKEVDKQIVQNGISAIVFDFKDTTFMDSSGIGLLMGRYKMVNYVGGSVVAVNVSKKIKMLLSFANVEKFIKCYTK